MHPVDAAGAVRQEYSRLANRYDRRWAWYIRSTVAETVRRLTIHPGDRVLDVGCGTGVLLESVIGSTSGVTLVGLDLCHEMLRVAKRRVSAQTALVTANAEALPFKSASFDVVVSNSSFHYWKAPQLGLAEIGRVLVPDGSIVVTDWCDDYVTCKICDLALRLFRRAHTRVYGLDECRDYAAAAGFQVTAAERYKINWLWGLMTIVAKKAVV